MRHKTGYPPTMPEPDDRWLSVSDICQHLGVSQDTIYRWIEQRALPAHRVGRFWKFKKADVDAWVRDGNAADAGEKHD